MSKMLSHSAAYPLPESLNINCIEIQKSKSRDIPVNEESISKDKLLLVSCNSTAEDLRKLEESAVTNDANNFSLSTVASQNRDCETSLNETFKPCVSDSEVNHIHSSYQEGQSLGNARESLPFFPKIKDFEYAVAIPAGKQENGNSVKEDASNKSSAPHLDCDCNNIIASSEVLGRLDNYGEGLAESTKSVPVTCVISIEDDSKSCVTESVASVSKHPLETVQSYCSCNGFSTLLNATEKKDFLDVQVLENGCNGKETCRHDDSFSQENCAVVSGTERTQNMAHTNLCTEHDEIGDVCNSNSLSSRFCKNENNATTCDHTVNTTGWKGYNEGNLAHNGETDILSATSIFQVVPAKNGVVECDAVISKSVDSVHVQEENIQNSLQSLTQSVHDEALCRQGLGREHKLTSDDSKPALFKDNCGKCALVEADSVECAARSSNALDKMEDSINSVSVQNDTKGIKEVEIESLLCQNSTAGDHEATHLTLVEEFRKDAFKVEQSSLTSSEIVDGSIAEVSQENSVYNAGLPANDSMRKNVQGSVATTGSARNSVSSVDGTQNAYGIPSDIIHEGSGINDIPFSEPIAVSGPISYSGAIPFSGNLSIRSDSSTTSTRSFAFPVLANEWNSSPVKMRQADPRYFRKKQKWRFLCFCAR